MLIIDNVLEGCGRSLTLTTSYKLQNWRCASPSVALLVLVLSFAWGSVPSDSESLALASKRTCPVGDAAMASSFVQHQTVKRKVPQHVQEVEEGAALRTRANSSIVNEVASLDNTTITGLRTDIGANFRKEVAAWHRRFLAHANNNLLVQRLAHRAGLSGTSMLLWLAAVAAVLIVLLGAFSVGRMATESPAESQRRWPAREIPPKPLAQDFGAQPSNGSVQARERSRPTPTSAGHLASSVGQLPSGGLASSIPPMSNREVQQTRTRLRFDAGVFGRITSNVLCPDLVVPAGNECSLLLPPMPMKYNCTIDDVNFEPIFRIQGQGGAIVLSSVGQSDTKVFGRCCEFGEKGELQICTATNTTFGWLCPVPNMKRAMERAYQVMTQHGHVALTVRGNAQLMEITVSNNLGDIVGLVHPATGDAPHPHNEARTSLVRTPRRNLLVGPGHDVGLIVLAIMGAEWLEARHQSSQPSSSFDLSAQQSVH
mmetsp:Transcript_35666/g.65397  ORF Transcript_35666/g.65397 Transcript_35666/m.65397 type:complete len:484 (-) Transcript_35666:69-1520(-)